MFKYFVLTLDFEWFSWQKHYLE